MQRANVNDRQSVVSVYGRTDFERDAARNARTDATVYEGLRIESSPDQEGWFNLVRTRVHVAEAKDHHGAFLFPYHRFSGAAGPGEMTEADPPTDHGQDYEAFLDRVLETARTAEFPGPIGRGEERLKGFHGG